MKTLIAIVFVSLFVVAACDVQEVDNTTPPPDDVVDAGTTPNTDAGTTPDAGPVDPCHGMCAVGTICHNATCVSDNSCVLKACESDYTCNADNGVCEAKPPAPPASVGSNCHRDGDCLSGICWSGEVGGQAVCIERGACYGLELKLPVGHAAMIVRFHRADGTVLVEEAAPVGGTWYRAPNGACAAVPMQGNGVQVVPQSCRGQWSWNDSTAWCNGGFADLGWPPALTTGCSWDGRHYGSDAVGTCSGPDDIATAPVATP